MLANKDTVCFKKRISSLLNLAFLILLFFSFLSCSEDAVSSESGSPKISEKLVIVFHLPDGLGDNSYTDILTYGIHKAAIDNNLLVYDVIPDNMENDAINKMQKVFASYREIIGAEENAEISVLFIFANEEYLGLLRLKDKFGEILSSTENPFTYLLLESMEITPDSYLLDEDSDLSVVSSVYVPIYGASYLAGKATKELLSSKTNPRVITLLANDYMESLNDGLQGFAQGYGKSDDTYIFNYYDTERQEASAITQLDFLVETINNQAAGGDIHGFNSQDIAYKIAYNDNFNHFDLYFPICGGSIHGLLRYNREWGKDSFYTVGMDSDMSMYSSQVPFSVVRHVDKAAKLCIKQWVADGKIPHFQRLGLEEGYTELVISKGYEKLSQTVKENLSDAIRMENEFYENQDKNSESGI